MNLLRYLLPLLGLMLFVAAPVAGQDDGPEPNATDAFWQGEYWNNQTLSGEPVLRRADETLNFNWERGAVAEGLAADHFSARWQRYILVPDPGGIYRFSAISDDGIRVWVDDVLLIDEWNDHAVQTFTGERHLAPGYHQLRVEYYENMRDAVVGVSYMPDSTINHWRGEYFNNRWLSGTPVVVREDPAIAFNWSSGRATTATGNDQFSARWTRQLQIDAEKAGFYRFHARADDGIRLWVDGQLVISEWSDHPAQTFTGDIDLSAGTHELKVEYYENKGLAEAQVDWTPMRFSDGWRAEYFNNRWLSGAPALTRYDDSLAFEWSSGSYAPGMPGDQFSARWTRQLHVADHNAGLYRFSVRADDGIRLWVDGEVVINEWSDHPVQMFMGQKYLAPGTHDVKVEYYENGGLAEVAVHWFSPSSNSLWVADYFNNTTLSGYPYTSGADEEIDFDWGFGAPVIGVPADNFSVRWLRNVYFEPGTYRFTTMTDDGVRLWADGHLLIDEWYEQAASSHSADIYLDGWVPLRMEYYEEQGRARAALRWTSVD